jgi:hypothetical protein
VLSDALANNTSHFHLRMFLQLARRAVYAFLDEQLMPLERLHHAWYASYFVEGWEADARLKHNLKDECITSNQRHCIHLNAKSLLLYMHWLISQPVLRACIPFAPHAWGEQQCEQLYRTMRAAHGSDTNFSLLDALQHLSKALLSEIVRTRRHAEFRWPQHRKHPAFERLRRAGTFLPADLTSADLTRVLEQARLDAIADLSAVGILIANLPRADDSSSNSDDDGDGDSDGDSDDAQLDMMHATAHLDDEPVDAAEVAVLNSLADTDDTDDDSDAPAAAAAAAPPAPDSLPDVYACRPDQPLKVTTSDTLLDHSGHAQHKQRACAYVSSHAKQSNDRALRYKRPQHASPMLP